MEGFEMNGDVIAWGMIKEGARWLIVRYAVPFVFVGLMVWLGAVVLLREQ